MAVQFFGGQNGIDISFANLLLQYNLRIENRKMGCQSSQLSARNGPQIKVTIVDSSFMKNQNDQVRQEMEQNNIKFQYFISLECFFQEFTKRYYNRVVTSVENYLPLKAKLESLGLAPNIFVVLNGHTLENTTFNTILVHNYQDLIRRLTDSKYPSMIPKAVTNQSTPKTKLDVKILSKPGQRSSQQTIFESALKKSNLSYEFYNSYQLLQQSLLQSTSKFIVTNYTFHASVVELFKDTKCNVICYCQFHENQAYSPDVYYLSDNYLDIANQIRGEIGNADRNYVRCSKVYLYQVGLQEFQEVKEVLEEFYVEVRGFSNIQKIIKQTTYFFCVTVLAIQSQIKTLQKYFSKNNYDQKIKLLPISPTTKPTPKGLFKLIRNIKKGYLTRKGITNSIDIIDKHYNSTKFQEIKKELENNSIKCFGYANLSQYIKMKKFISPFIICNFQERTLLTKYMKQLQCKAKVIIFCNKNKINNDLKDNSNYSYVSSHFGKIIKFIKKTHVFMPVISHQDQIQFKQKLEKIKSKNRRISALKWSQISAEEADQDQKNFEFLNIAKETNNGSIRDIQKAVATIWKADSSILNLQSFKEEFIKSLNQLRKIHKISTSQLQFNQLVDKIKEANFSELLEKIKTFFDADNELGLEINNSLMRTETLQKKQITNMRQFLLLVFMNFMSGFQIPRIGTKTIIHWTSNPLIQKCQIGSFLFCKHFLIFYEDTSSTNLDKLGKYKIQIQLEYNTLVQNELLINSFIRYKDKFIFSPFSQFQLIKIEDAGGFKIIRLKYVKNVDFLKYIYQDNLLKSGENFGDLMDMMKKSTCKLVDSAIRDTFVSNLERIRSIGLFQKGEVAQSIEIHRKLIKEIEQKQNLDSVLVNQLNFELSCFYFKIEKNREAGQVIKQVLDADPGTFIKGQCQKMIKQVVEIDNTDRPSTRRISEQAMKTFIWLKNKQEQNEQSENSGDKEGSENEEELAAFQRDLNCMEVDDIDVKNQLDGVEMGKENIQIY